VERQFLLYMPPRTEYSYVCTSYAVWRLVSLNPSACRSTAIAPLRAHCTIRYIHMPRCYRYMYLYVCVFYMYVCSCKIRIGMHIIHISSHTYHRDGDSEHHVVFIDKNSSEIRSYERRLSTRFWTFHVFHCNHLPTHVLLTVAYKV
jgi:hypothetical protein